MSSSLTVVMNSDSSLHHGVIPSFLEDIARLTLSNALSVLTAEICLQLLPGIDKLCRPISVHRRAQGSIEDMTMDPMSRGNPRAQGVWLCANTHFFTVMKIRDNTFVYSHTNNMLYFAHPMCVLSSECPNHTAFLGQFTVDGVTPRLLVFDCIVDFTQSHPAAADARADRLRAIGTYLQAPLCVVQWVGELQYLFKFDTERLPHKVDGFLELQPDPFTVFHRRGPPASLVPSQASRSRSPSPTDLTSTSAKAFSADPPSLMGLSGSSAKWERRTASSAKGSWAVLSEDSTASVPSPKPSLGSDEHSERPVNLSAAGLDRTVNLSAVESQALQRLLEEQAWIAGHPLQKQSSLRAHQPTQLEPPPSPPPGV